MQNTRAFADSIAEMAEALLGIEGEEQARIPFQCEFPIQCICTVILIVLQHADRSCHVGYQ